MEMGTQTRIEDENRGQTDRGAKGNYEPWKLILSTVASACDVPSSLIERRFWTGAKPEEPEVWEVSFHFVD